MKRHLLLAGGLVTLLLSPDVPARELSLDQWLDAELIPTVNDKLLNHPRFKGETVMFVVLDDKAPAPVSNELALSLRDRLLDAALDTDGVRIGWRQGSASHARGDAADCSRDDVHYYIGIELSQKFDRRYEVRIRAMDLEDRSWVGGFGKVWRGYLSSAEHRASQHAKIDSTFLGAREAPFNVSQTDLLARHLAHELSCALSGQTSGEYVVPPPGDYSDDSDNVLAGTLQLVSKNIAAHSAVSLSAETAGSNAVLSGQAHAINDSLHQYWLTITPSDAASELATLSVSAYVKLPATKQAYNAVDGDDPAIASRPAVPATPHYVSIPNAAAEPFIGPLHLVSLKDSRHCDPGERYLQTSGGWSGNRQCSLLEASSHADAVVFVLEHQPHLGLVRLGGKDCSARTTAHVVRSGHRMQFPIAWVGSGNGQAKPADRWLVSPPADTYYAVAVANARVARQMANHIDKLPVRCGATLRPGLTGTRMRQWLDDFATLAARTADAIDWRAIELKDVL